MIHNSSSSARLCLRQNKWRLYVATALIACGVALPLLQSTNIPREFESRFRDGNTATIDSTTNAPISVTSITRNGSDIVIGFDAVQRATYRLQRKLNITDATWGTVSGVNDLTAANDGPAQFTDSGALNLGQAFYRVAAFNLNANVAFVTSTTTAGNMGGIAAADNICQNAAVASGISGTFRAYISSSTTNAISRLGTASGWVRVDGKPIANSASDFVAGTFYYPLRLTNAGVDIGDAPVITGTSVGVVSGGTCNDYSSTSGFVLMGSTAAQSGMFSAFSTNACSASARLYCAEVDRVASVQTVSPPQRYVFVTSGTWTPGGGLASADAVCQAEANAGALAGTYKALLATAAASAASRFNTAGSPWGRVDGALLAASASATFTSTFWDTSPGVSANGSQYFGNIGVWSGATSPTALGTATSTCNDWTNNTSAATGRAGRAGFSSIAGFFGLEAGVPCNITSYHLTCLQQ